MGIRSFSVEQFEYVFIEVKCRLGGIRISIGALSTTENRDVGVETSYDFSFLFLFGLFF